MKTLHLSLIMFTVVIFLGFGLQPAHTDDANGISIQNVKVQPSTVKVGDTFTVTATLVNNSTVPIVLDSGACSIKDTQIPFFTVMFDNHAKIKAKNMTCAGVGLSQILNPGKNIIGTSPSPDSEFTYIATESGTANATMTFSYHVINQTDPTQPGFSQTISKSLLFTIYDNNTGTKTITETVLPPLKQFKLGADPYFVNCRQDLELVIKLKDNSPACVKSTSLTRLLGQGWIYAHDNNGKYRVMENPKSAGNVTQNVSQIIIPDGIVSNPQLNFEPQVIKVLVGVNSTVEWIKKGTTPIMIQSTSPYSHSSFHHTVYPEKPFRFTYNQTGEYWYRLDSGAQGGKIIVTTPEFEKSIISLPKLFNSPEDIVKTLVVAAGDQIGPSIFTTSEQLYSTRDGRIALGDPMYELLPIQYDIHHTISLGEPEAIIFAKDFMNKIGLVMDGTEKIDVENFTDSIRVTIHQTNRYEIENQYVTFGFSNDSSSIYIGGWHNYISKETLAIDSTGATDLAKKFLETELKGYSYVDANKITPTRVQLEVIDDKLMYIVTTNLARFPLSLSGVAGNMEVMMDAHNGKVFGWG